MFMQGINDLTFLLKEVLNIPIILLVHQGQQVRSRGPICTEGNGKRKKGDFFAGCKSYRFFAQGKNEWHFWVFLRV